ncbi:MAG: hypothetical protein M1483_08770 [Actinobacteria bacterium]|nr:hypothetical protein [Actinomycetota bacterium]
MTKLFDTLLGRTKPARPNLDNLFALSSAFITLEAECGFSASGQAAVCFKPATGQFFAEAQTEFEQLLKADEKRQGAVKVYDKSDSFGYNWVVIEDTDTEGLITEIHMVNSTLQDSGYGPQLLCSVFGLSPSPTDDNTPTNTSGVAGGDVLTKPQSYLVYLYKRGTFYPFAPIQGQKRNNELELKFKALLSSDLQIEPELDRWFPLWDIPL